MEKHKNAKKKKKDHGTKQSTKMTHFQGELKQEGRAGDVRVWLTQNSNHPLSMHDHVRAPSIDWAYKSISASW